MVDRLVVLELEPFDESLHHWHHPPLGYSVASKLPEHVLVPEEHGLHEALLGPLLQAEG